MSNTDVACLRVPSRDSANPWSTSEWSTVRTLALGGGINAAGTAMVIPLLTTYLTGPVALSVTTAGWVLAVFFVGRVFGHMVGGAVADGCGRRPVMLVSTAGVALTAVAVASSGRASVIIVAIALYGLFAGAYEPASTAMISDVVPAERRDYAFATLRSAINVGFAVGPALASVFLVVDGETALRNLFVLDAATSVALLVLIARRVDETLDLRRSSPPDGTGFRAVVTDRRFIAFAALWALVAFVYVQVFSTMGPLLRADFGIAPHQFARWLSLNAVLVVLFQVAVTNAARRWSAGVTIMLGAIAQGTGLLMILTGGRLGILLVSMAVFTVGEMLLAPTGTAAATRFAASHLHGRYVAVFMLAGSAGLAAGPLVGGMFIDAGRGDLLLWTLFALGAVSGLGLKAVVDHPRAPGRSPTHPSASPRRSHRTQEE